MVAAARASTPKQSFEVARASLLPLQSRAAPDVQAAATAGRARTRCCEHIVVHARLLHVVQPVEAKLPLRLVQLQARAARGWGGVCWRGGIVRPGISEVHPIELHSTECSCCDFGQDRHARHLRTTANMTVFFRALAAKSSLDTLGHRSRPRACCCSWLARPRAHFAAPLPLPSRGRWLLIGNCRTSRPAATRVLDSEKISSNTAEIRRKSEARAGS